MVDNHEFVSKHDIMKSIADEYCSSCKEDEVEDCQIGCDAYLRDIKELIRRIPAADVVEAVRCKDCKLWDYSYALGGMVCMRTRCRQPEDGFCNWAEKKEVQSNNG